MANDTSLSLRQAVVRRLRANADLIAIVPAERNYGMRSPPDPAWPFTRYGSPDSQPLRAQCLDGATISFTIHAFSRTPDSTAIFFEDECATINAAASRALDGATLALDAPTGAKAHVRWIGSQIVPDAAEASAWHGINRFEARVAS